MTVHSKYDTRVNPVYQINFAAALSGKRLSATKRRIHFTFGFSNPEALAQGHSGVECRGEEHEVLLVWSLTSGRRIITADDQEVHFSVGSRFESKFETSWTIAGGHTIKIIAHAAPPFTKIPGFRQYDLLLDGCSFFDMPRIYELGKSPTATTTLVTRDYMHGSSILPEASFRNNNEHNPKRRGALSCAEPESRILEIEKKNTISLPTLTAPVTTLPTDLLSNDDVPLTSNDLLEANLCFVDEFTPKTLLVQSESPSFALLTNHIMSSYNTASPGLLPALTNGTMGTHPCQVSAPTFPPSTTQYPVQQSNYTANYSQQGFYQTPATNNQQQQHTNHPQVELYAPAAFYYDPDTSPESKVESIQIKGLSMEPLNVDDLEFGNMSDYDRVVDRLVHLGDITEQFESPEQRKRNLEKAKAESFKSKPVSPTTNWNVGNNASLTDIKTRSQPKTLSTQIIMRSYEYDPTAPQANALVAYDGSIPQTQGFGAGFHSQQQYHNFQGHSNNFLGTSRVF